MRMALSRDPDYFSDGHNQETCPSDGLNQETRMTDDHIYGRIELHMSVVHTEELYVIYGLKHELSRERKYDIIHLSRLLIKLCCWKTVHLRKLKW